MLVSLQPGRFPASNLLLGLGSCALVLLGPSCRSGVPGPGGEGGTVPAVEAVQARHGALPLRQRLSGVVRARNQVGIYPEVSALITEVLVENGGAVERGQPLVRLRDTEFREQLKQATAGHRIAEAQLRQAKAVAREARQDLDRMRSLVEKGLASEAELEAAETRAESAEANVALARARLEQAQSGIEEQEENLTRTVIRSPTAGRVGNRNAEIGMLAGPGDRLFTVGQLDSLRVEIVLTDRMLGYIEAGQRTEISASGAILSAPLSRISPFLHPVTHSTEAEIDVGNPEGAFKPGMFVTVDVFYGESEEATLVPQSALYEHPTTGLAGVYAAREPVDPEAVAEAGTPGSMSLTEPVAFEFVPTEVVAQGRMEAAVRGVEPGAWVITLGQNLLGGEAGRARVRPVKWERVERLQHLQREDLMENLVQPQMAN